MCFRKAIAWVVVCALAINAVAPPVAQGKEFLQTIFKRQEPPSVADPSVEMLAEQIDWLEKHIDNYGTVVPKHPDVWGQARLTKHRQEFEKVMYKELGNFNLLVNGTISRSDSAFLANAFALSAAVSGQTPAPNSITSVSGMAASGDFVAATTIKPEQFNFDKPGIALEPTIALDQRARYLNHLHELRRMNEGDDTSVSPGYALNLVRIPISAISGRSTRKGYGAEITLNASLHLSPTLLPTTFRSLVINDVVDQLGLPLTQVADKQPWEIIEKGCCEISSISAEIMQISKAYDAYALAEEIASKDLKKSADAKHGVGVKALRNEGLDNVETKDEHRSKTRSTDQFEASTAQAMSVVKALEAAAKITQLPDTLIDATNSLKETAGPSATTLVNDNASQFTDDDLDTKSTAIRKTISKVAKEAKATKETKDRTREQLKGSLRDAYTRLSISSKTLNDALKTIAAPVGPASRARQARNPIPPSQVEPVYGADELIHVAKAFYEAYQGPNVRWNDVKSNRVMLLDVQRYLADELDAAYDLLSIEENVGLWVEYVPAVTEQILSGRFQALCQTRCAFYNQIRHKWPEFNCHPESPCNPLAGAPTPAPDESVPAGKMVMDVLPEPDDLAPGDCRGRLGTCDEQVVKSLAWAIIVEAAMLNHQLIKDMQHIAMEKGCNCAAACAEGLFMPVPSPEACAAFNEYVQCRWPLHIFALDPVVQAQNIEDAFNRRRELQLTMSLGFIGGQINAQDMMQFSRQLDTQIETIALNQTAVGFSHGDDTFGWRFYPRLQTPPPPGTIVAFGQTLFGGPSPDCDLLQRQLEPGMRECTALVIMPSFVPHILIESRASWFRLNERAGISPTKHHRELSMVDTMRLSRSIRSMHDMADVLCDSQSYRHGDVELLLARVHQLDRALPLQSMLVQVPIENTVGGYQLFNHGVSDLAPELRGWYGAPGILVSSSKKIARMPCVTDATGACNCSSGSATASATTPTASTAGAPAAGAATAGAATATSPAPAGAAPAAAPAASATATSAPKSPLDPYTLVDCPCDGTTLFLVGDHFSVHDTRVIAGGVCIPNDAYTLLSREVMRISIPSNVQTVKIDGETWVDIHVATPYGVTGHLHVPAITDAKDDSAPSPIVPTVKWDQDPTYTAAICYKSSNTSQGSGGSAAKDPSQGTSTKENADAPACSFAIKTTSGPIGLHAVATFPAPPVLMPTHGTIIVQLQPQASDGTTIPPFYTEPVQVDFRGNLTSADVSTQVEKAIEKAVLAHLKKSQNATSVVGDTYLEFAQIQTAGFDPTESMLPVVKFGNQFKISLTTTVGCDCSKTSDGNPSPPTTTDRGRADAGVHHTPLEIAAQFDAARSRAPVFPVSQQIRPEPDPRFSPAVVNPMRDSAPVATPVAMSTLALPAQPAPMISVPAPLVQAVPVIQQALPVVQQVLPAQATPPAHNVVMMVPTGPVPAPPPKRTPLKSLHDKASHLLKHTKPFDPPNR